MKGAVMFSPEMAKAVRDGRKVMTRRMAWHPPDPDGDGTCRPTIWQSAKPGEILWVREPFRGAAGYEWKGLPPTQWGNKPIWYPADGEPPADRWGFLSDKVRPARQMPRAFSRTTIRVESVRMERLQDISPADCDAEGFAGDFPHVLYPGLFPNADAAGQMTLPECFGVLWNSLHGKGAWERNPEVMVIGFTFTPTNIDQIAMAGEPA